MAKQYPISVRANGLQRLYRCWANMVQRCSNPRVAAFARYGGRGIIVCPEWRQFSAFSQWALAHGYADHLSIDRINGDGGYSPENCRWATRAEQNRNQARALKGEDGSLYSDAAAANGIGRHTLYGRLRRGWTPERATAQPPRPKRAALSATNH